MFVFLKKKKKETACKAGDKCLSPHQKVDKQQNKKPKKGDHSQKRRESDDKNAVAVEKFVAQMGCVSQDSEKPDAESLGTDSKNTIHSVYATSQKYPGKERTIVWKNTSQKSSSAKSLRYEI